MRLTVYRRILEPEAVPNGRFRVILKFLAEDVDLVSWFDVSESRPGYMPKFREVSMAEARFIIEKEGLTPA